MSLARLTSRSGRSRRVEFYKKPTDDLINAGSVASLMKPNRPIDFYVIYDGLKKFLTNKRLRNLNENLLEEIHIY